MPEAAEALQVQLLEDIASYTHDPLGFAKYAYEWNEGEFEFHGGIQPADPAMYLNKRAECWGLLRDHLKDGAEIPDDPDLERQLTGPNYGIVQGKVQHGSIFLESKEDMKKRGLASPDKGDCYAMTFGITVAPRPVEAPPYKAKTVWG